MRAPEWRMARIVSYRPWHYWGGTVAWILYFVFPLLPGWLVGRLFSELQRATPGREVAILLGALLAAELVAVVFIWYGHYRYMQGMHAAVAVIRANAMAGQLASGGRELGRRQVSTGDAVARLRDDPVDMANLLDNWTDLFGSLVYGGVAAWILAGIDPWAALAGIGPLFAIGAANTLLGQAARRFRQRARAATSSVTSFLNAAFAASLTVKLAGAQRDVVRRLDQLNRRRSKTMVADQIWEDGIWATNATLTDVCVGAALVVAARGRLDAGEVTLFASYLFSLVWLPQRLGGLIVGRRRYEVSAGRLGELTAPHTNQYDPLLQRRELPILGGPPALAPTVGRRIPLQTLSVEGLTVTSRGLQDVSFTVNRGELVVVAGPVGSGKSSLLRALVGLLDFDRGTVRWNDAVVTDRAAFFVPPQCAYVAQVPRLFAESLRDNVTLGYRWADEDVVTALTLAAFEQDLAIMPDGLATLIGTRGVRLSGGQVQRAAAARAFLHRPELLVLDDLASALDVETEIALWDRLTSSGATILTATNRPTALHRADRIIDLGAVGSPNE
ncbi:MAG: ATP-binding cassette domain-containing protein [Acidimicrobiales bacterium]